ncbi:MFS transporter [Saccharothrix sp. HUAS TT1]|uniref:MFS transporter n=1 Tax=unclassified Saccharothrix TaxID=2593673 RepID=UPI00345B97A9
MPDQVGSAERGTGRGPGLSLPAVCLTVVLFPLAITGSSVALPAINAEFQNSLASGLWVVNGYNLTYAAFMLATGSLADLVGRRGVFRVGVVLFAAGSLVSALAPNILVLDLARVVAGVGAAAATTSGSAILADAFEGVARAKAFGVFGTAVGVGLVFGPSLSGLLIGSFGWRSVFLLPAVIGALVLLLTPVIRESRNPRANRVDWAGTTTFTAALLLLIFALVQGPQWGWGDQRVIASFAGAVVALIAFVVVERRQEQPMFDLGLLSQPRFVGISLATVPVVFGFSPLVIYLPSYLASVDGLGAAQIGLFMLMLTVLALVFPGIAGVAAKWVPARVQIVLTAALAAIGLAWFTVIEPGIGYLSLLGPLALVGIAVGLSFGLLDGAAVSSVEATRAGMAAGMFNTVRLAGETISIAVAGALLVGFTQNAVAARAREFGGSVDADAVANALNQGDLARATALVPEGRREEFAEAAGEAFASGLHGLLWTMAALCAVTFVVIALLLRERRSTAPMPEVASKG